MRKFIVAITLLVIAIGGIIILRDTSPNPGTEDNADGQLSTEACDAYIASFKECLNKIPQTLRPGMEMTLNAMQSQWHASGKAPESRKVMEQTCKSAAQNAKTSMARYGCTF
jgi:hypothetical protein